MITFIPAPFRVATWVPLIGGLTLLQSAFPETILELPGYTKLSILDFVLAVAAILSFVWNDNNLFFLAVLFFRYFRLILNIFGYVFLNESTPIPEHPTVTSGMCHVIIPSIDPGNEDFERCLRSVLEKRPGWITVVTATEDQTAEALRVIAELPRQEHTHLAATTGPMANKRHQLAHVIRQMATRRDENKDVLVVFVDDHVWWPSPRFLSTIIAPLEDPKVGIVGMHKRPERVRGDSFTDSFLNFIACLYLERHNFEVCSSNAIDGSAFVISGRTSVIRASIVMDDEFLDGFVDEWFFFGMFGPLNPDDDNYITRYIIRKGWEIKWQNQPEALMQTSLGVTGGYKKFYGQLQRWARSQWRSNPCSVFTDRSVWRRGYIWGGILHCVSFINFALFWDALILRAWYRSSYAGFTIYHLALLILGSKFVKIAPFFYYNPRDLWLFPFQVLFGYFHSFIKFWALVTFYDHSWSGRNLAAAGALAADNGGDDDGNAPQDSQRRRSLHADREKREAIRYIRQLNVHSHPSELRSFPPGRRPYTPTQYRVTKTLTPPTYSAHSSYSPLTPDLPDVPETVLTAIVNDSPVLDRSEIFTPWGTVRSKNDHLIAANVREPQFKSGFDDDTNSAASSAWPLRSLNDGSLSTPGLTHRESQELAFPTPSPSEVSARGTTRRNTELNSLGGYGADDELARGRKLSREDYFSPSSSVLVAMPNKYDSRRASLWSGVHRPSTKSRGFQAHATVDSAQDFRRDSELLGKPSSIFVGPTMSYSQHSPDSTEAVEPFTGSLSPGQSHDFHRGSEPSHRSSVAHRTSISSLYVSPDPIQVGSGNDHGPMRSTYARKFPRGDDCLRTHPDGSHLSVPSGRKGQSGQRRCRSPSPNWYPVIPGHPRI